MTAFRYDPQHRRHVEGWNIVCYDGEDTVGLTAPEWDDVALDFLLNGMPAHARKSYERGIALGSARSMALLGELCEREGDPAEAYRWYLEAALADDRLGLERLAALYRKGVYVRQDIRRAKALARLARGSNRR